MLLTIILLIIGFVLIVKGSDLFVDGSSSVARLMGIPAVVVGLTIVSMGTSAPEAAVSITAGFRGSNEIAISNLVGSNTFNMLCVAGLSAAITPFVVDKIIIKRDFPVCLGVMAITILMGLDGVISRLDGIILLAIFVAYITILVISAIRNHDKEEDGEKPMSPVKSIIFMVIGLGAIIGGGELVVRSAQKIALAFGMSETLIGVTIIAIGTSLPELVTSVIAARKGQSGIAIGNVVGSSFFNLAFVLGMSSAANPVGVVPEAMIDAVIMIAVNALGFVYCITGRKLARWEGISLVCIYVAYTAYLIVR
ncbi:MAG: calcium/sodium antiporter [Clostridia bacterium]|nr:calcium/sodium antiporter [Clostridia bacterium]